MSLFRLTDHATFDNTDGQGIILDTLEGVYFGLNPTATLMLQAALQFDTLDEVVAHLKNRIRASDDELRGGVEALAVQLRQQHLLTPQQASKR